MDQLTKQLTKNGGVGLAAAVILQWSLATFVAVTMTPEVVVAIGVVIMFVIHKVEGTANETK